MTALSWSGSWRSSERGHARTIEQATSLAAIALLFGWTVAGLLESRRLDDADHAARAHATHSSHAAEDAPAPEVLIAAYGGTPYTYDSDVHFKRIGRGAVRDFTVEKVEWEGQPFKHPVYYGVRVARWSEGGQFGGMVDFTHSKAISRMAQEVRIKGTLDGQPVPEKARISDLFQKLEFSHGHNMLMATGLMRLSSSFAPRVSPYVGLGAGVSLPHTEIHLHKNDPKRTYEYQFTGPSLQGLVGIEFRLPRVSCFVEYKFTFASYSAPLTGRDGTWLPLDVWAQIQRWLAGGAPTGGYADTQLASHQLVGGLGVRVGLAR
ncbi:MAG: hypothetical protein C0511_00695 [Hyphomicrobium sp.]|nr:hypothetical protein [Hyphomicrobium sp.]PPC84124.1 MAG: hypothetical protein CTY40_00695 [Hyphomicrobium sp.]